jgi:anaerobic magnesium-protoporphyrin IX monomethyl ester cyclase
MDIITNTFGFFPMQPNPFTANITAYLKSKELYVRNLDINLIIWQTLLSKEYIAELEYKPEVFKETPFFLAPSISRKQYEVLKKTTLSEIDSANGIFKSDDFYAINKLNWATYIHYNVQKLIYYHYGTFFTNKVPIWPKITYNVKSVSDIEYLSTSTIHNPLVKIIAEKVLPVLQKENPKKVGVEIMFPWEIIGARTLNMLIKEHLKDTHISFLGNGFDEINFARQKDKLVSNNSFFFGFDSIFLARNDQAIYELFKNERVDFESIKNTESIALLNNETNETHINGPYYEGKINFDICPDYSDLPLKDYFTPKTVFFDKLSSKCFWSKCSYCSINVFKNEQQISDIDVFVHRLEQYANKYNCNHIWLIDEATPPNIIERFADTLLKKNLSVIWSVRTRIDERLSDELLVKMQKAGCRELWIGLEAISPAILKKMNKTLHPETYSDESGRIMKTCNNIGIGIHFCLLMNFPGETRDDRKLLVDFFQRNKENYWNIPLFATFNEFMLMKDSPIYNTPQDYDIQILEEKTDNFDMVAVPFKYISEKNSLKKQSELFSKNVKKTSQKLLNLFVKDKILIYLWYSVTDTCQELLLKEKYTKENPFQRKFKLKHLVLLVLTIFLANRPLFNNFISRLQKKYANTQ